MAIVEKGSGKRFLTPGSGGRARAFDDALHVVPETLVMKDEALYGVVWQTKVERQKKGTRFAAAKCLRTSGEDWMEDGWSAASFEMDDRDYFL